MFIFLKMRITENTDVVKFYKISQKVVCMRPAYPLATVKVIIEIYTFFSAVITFCMPFILLVYNKIRHAMYV
jgi:hypothetical protein